ncbi:hypothetical protein, partial [Microcoleus sp. herbarium2]|uniref:hypothetical protein n=1 Tax=Microcoleus sp. herbarium2 TaxID=3055433 RepID=UPI002FD23F00
PGRKPTRTPCDSWGAECGLSPYLSSATGYIATAKTVRTLLMAETIDFIASSFFLLPSSFFLLL